LPEIIEYDVSIFVIFINVDDFLFIAFSTRTWWNNRKLG
jgi:hypothetical protein